MHRLIAILCCLLLTGCVSVTTGLQLAQFGVKIGFDVKEYVEYRKEESKQIIESEK